ncbi:CBS domain-containing protein [Citreimonas salinaria]|uniref:CBS domain-containing protein n=1 Tax=Citreimonas salinaria TaxID=321339 RepID=A0A1H3NR38_9RHOB|nr:CBS domain-containing protein [Citreimonas salinaria]SDY91391.1 CBS domain-containing protein [Citreimonas salinaria]
MVAIEKFLPTARKRMCCIGSDAALLQAARLLESGHDMLLVCEADGRMIGVLTKTDAVRQIGICTGASCTAPVIEAMTSAVTTATPEGQLREVWEIMKARGFKNIPVVDPHGTPLGVLNARDVLQILWHDVQKEEELLFNYVMNVGYR